MKSFFKTLLHVVIAVCTTACTLESIYSLPSDTQITTDYVGQWVDENEPDIYLDIQNYAQKGYQISIVEKNKTAEKSIAFTSTIKGHTIMNVRDINKDNQTTYSFYKIKADHNTLTFYDVNKELAPPYFKSQSELIAFFEDNSTNDDLFINKQTLKRKK